MLRQKKRSTGKPTDRELRKKQFRKEDTMKDVIIEMFLALAAVNVATKQFSCYPY